MNISPKCHWLILSSLMSKLSKSLETKYLIYQPIGGLNNQYISLLEALLISSYLNRTLVLPHWKSQHDKPYSGVTEDYYEVSKLYENFNTISLNEFKQIHSNNGSIELPIVYKLMLKYRCEFYYPKFKSMFKQICSVVKDLQYFKDFGILFKTEKNVNIEKNLTKEEIIELFGNVKENVLALNITFSLLDLDRSFHERFRLMKLLQPKKCILDYSKQFIQTIPDISNNSYIAAHFRRGDFKIYKELYMDNESGFEKLFSINSLTPLWPSISEAAFTLKQIQHSTGIKTVFIASDCSDDDEDLKSLSQFCKIVRYQPPKHMDKIMAALVDMVNFM